YFFLFLLLLLPACASPNENRVPQQAPPAAHHPGVDSPSSLSGPVKLMDGMGKIDFAITTKSRDAQDFFNQGVAQLYGFWFGEAERSFQQATKLDPGAAMAYWGVAMAATGNFVPMYQLNLTPNRRPPVTVPPRSSESRAREAIVKAEALRDSITPREILYIEAVGALHNPFLQDPDAAYIVKMRQTVKSFPDDLEAKSILALALENGYDPATKSPKDGTPESLRRL